MLFTRLATEQTQHHAGGENTGAAGGREGDRRMWVGIALLLGLQALCAVLFYGSTDASGIAAYGERLLAGGTYAMLPYLPGTAPLYAGLALLTRQTGLPCGCWMRLFCVVVQTLVVLLAWRYFTACRLPARERRYWTLLLVASPVVLLFDGFHGQWDGLVALLLIVVIWYDALPRRSLPAALLIGMLLGGAVVIKTSALLFSALCLLRPQSSLRERLLLGAGFAVPILAVLLPYAGHPASFQSLLARVTGYVGSDPQFGPSLLASRHELSLVTVLLVLSCAVCCLLTFHRQRAARHWLTIGALIILHGGVLWYTTTVLNDFHSGGAYGGMEFIAAGWLIIALLMIAQRLPLATALVGVCLVVYCFAPRLAVQYLYWIIPFAVLARDRWVIPFSLTAGLGMVGWYGAACAINSGTFVALSTISAIGISNVLYAPWLTALHHIFGGYGLTLVCLAWLTIWIVRALTVPVTETPATTQRFIPTLAATTCALGLLLLGAGVIVRLNQAEPTLEALNLAHGRDALTARRDARFGESVMYRGSVQLNRRPARCLLHLSTNDWYVVQANGRVVRSDLGDTFSAHHGGVYTRLEDVPLPGVTLDLAPFLALGPNTVTVRDVHTSWLPAVPAQISWAQDLSPWGHATAFHAESSSPAAAPAWWNIAILLVGYALLFGLWAGGTRMLTKE